MPSVWRHAALSTIGLLVFAAQAVSADFANPERVTIRGYNDDAMEPFLSRDGQYLLFNNSNDPAVDTNLHYAERIDDLTFQYRGEIKDLSTPQLDAVPAMTRDGTLYFISTRSYDTSISTVYRTQFDGRTGSATPPALVTGTSLNVRGKLIFDLDISADGNTLIVTDGVFSSGAAPDSADLAQLTRGGDGFLRNGNSSPPFVHVNTEALEFAPAVSADGLELYFTRFTLSWILPLSDPPSIYVARRATTAEPFGEPERIATIDGFAEAPTLSPDEHALYFHKKIGDRYEIWRVTR